jgi:hypothetical protein
MATKQPDESANNLPQTLARPAQRALANAGITRIEHLAAMSEAEIRLLHGIGPNALRQLRQALDAHGLGFKDTN